MWSPSIPSFPPPPAPAYNWTGGWAGVVLGYGNASSIHCDGVDCAGGAPTFPSVSSSGGLAGLALGYNWQSGNVVYGVMADYVAARIRGSTTSTITYGCGAGNACVTDVTGMATLRGRLGWAMDRSMIYASAGVAQIRGEGGTTNAAPPLGSFSATVPVLGVGFETAVGGRMTLSGEVLHTFGTDPMLVQPTICLAPGCQIDNLTTTTARIGLNFRF